MAIMGRPPKKNAVTRHKRKGGDLQDIEITPYPAPSPKKLFPRLINPLDHRKGVEPEEKLILSETTKFIEALGNYPLTDDLQEAQWLYLKIGLAYLDLAYKTGEIKYMKEFRAIIKEFGITPEGVLKQRINFAQAKEAEQKNFQREEKISAREMYR